MDKIKIVGIALFCGALGIGGLTTLVLPQKEKSVRENRVLETRPKLTAENVLSGSYQDQYEKYLNDQMIFRDGWVRLAVGTERMAGRLDVNGVYIGKDGYLLEKYDPSDFDEAQIEENVECLSAFLNDAAERYGKGRVSCLLLPDKASAMPDKLPEGAQSIAQEERKTVELVRARLDEPDILPDVAEALKNHQDEYIYYRTDHHWTTLGAFYAYRVWADATGHQAGRPEDYDREEIFDDFYGTTWNKTPAGVEADTVELFHSEAEQGITVDEDDGEIVSDSFYFPAEAAEGFNRYDVFFSGNTAGIRISTEAGAGRSLLVVKDSFANCFVPFLAGDYDEILMVDFRYGNENIYDILDDCDGITDVLVMYNTAAFMQDTKLDGLGQKEEAMEEFDADSFFDDLEDEEE